MCLYTSIDSELSGICFFFFFSFFSMSKMKIILKRLLMLHMERNNSLIVCITGRNVVFGSTFFRQSMIVIVL